MFTVRLMCFTYLGLPLTRIATMYDKLKMVHDIIVLFRCDTIYVYLPCCGIMTHGRMSDRLYVTWFRGIQ